MKELDRDNLEDYLLSVDKLYVLFGTNKCGACRIAKSQTQKLIDSKIAPNVTYLFVNTEVYHISKKMGQVKATPSIVFYSGGKEEGRVEGFVESSVKDLLIRLNNK